MDMQIQRWRETLAAMTQPDGWIGLGDGKSRLADEVLARYEQSDDWIGQDFTAAETLRDGQDRVTKTDAARIAERRRDAVLQLAFVHELAIWQARQRSAKGGVIDTLTKAVCNAADSAPTGLRPRADFAGSERAFPFFQGELLKRIRTIDEKMRTVIAERLEQHRYDPTDNAVIDVWARAWTAAAALIPLDWARQRNLATPRAIAWALWCQVDSKGEPLSNFRARAQIIPTASTLTVGIHLELATRPAVARALGRSREIRVLKEGTLCRLSIALNELDYEANHGSPRYRGRNVLQLYLAVTADCLHEANEDKPMADSDQPSSDTGAGDAGDPRSLAKEHQQLLRATKAARESREAIKQAADGTRFVLSHEVPVAGGNASRMLVATTTEWELLVQRALHFVPVEGAPGARWQPIGSVRLWHELGREVEWIDLLVVARIGEQQIRLPVTMEDDVTDGERSLLVLDEGAKSPVSAEALRGAFERRDAVVGVVIRKGLGAFVVLEFDMDAQPPAGGGV